MSQPAQIERFENGLRFASHEMPHMESVALGFWTSTGSRHENLETHGAAHFIEHLLFKGTPTRSANEIVRAVERLGGNLNAFTSEDHTCYYVKGPAAHAEALLDVLGDMFIHPSFTEDDVNLERDVIKEEIAMVRDQPSQLLEDLLNEAAWDGHPLGRSITGTEESLDHLNRSKLLEFYQDHYVGARTLITAAGHIDHARLRDQIARMAANLPSGTPEPPTTVPPRAPGLRIETRDIEQVHLAIGFHTIGRLDDRRHALKLLDVLLGGNMSSVLFQRLREEEAVCYHVQSDVVSFADTGLLGIFTGIDPENLERALEVTESCLRQFLSEPPPAALLREACDYATGQSRVSLENTNSRMMWAGESLLAYDKVHEPAVSRKKLAAVTPEEIHDVALELLKPDNLALASVCPPTCEAALHQWASTNGL